MKQTHARHISTQIVSVLRKGSCIILLNPILNKLILSPPSFEVKIETISSHNQNKINSFDICLWETFIIYLLKRQIGKKILLATIIVVSTHKKMLKKQ